MNGMRVVPGCVLAVALIGLAGCTGSGADEEGPVLAAGGTVVADDRGVGRTNSILLPTGRLDLTVTGPRTSTPEIDGTARRAPESGSLIGVGWRWEGADRLPAAVVGGEESVPEIALVVGDERYPLAPDMAPPSSDSTDEALRARGTVWVGLEAGAEDAAAREAVVEVTFDGLVQVVDPQDDDMTSALRTSARSLYTGELRRSPMFTCDGPAAQGLQLNGSCLVEVATTPWHSAVGWSPDGDPWVVVTLRASLARTWQSTSGELGEWTLTGPGIRPKYRLDGLEPVKVVHDTVQGWGDNDSVGDVVVFDPGTSGPFEAVARIGRRQADPRPVTWTTRFD